MRHIKNNNLGLTLIELVLSLAIILMIALAFFPLFTLSAKTNVRSEAKLNSTYLGSNAMELIYSLSRELYFEDIEDKMSEEGYVKAPLNNTYFKYEDEKFITVNFTEESEGNLIRVITKIYEDEGKTKPEAQYEALYSWFGRGILGEEE